MAEPAGPFYLLRAGPGRYLCWCRPGPGGTVYVTDALEVWAAELGASRPLGCRWQPEEYGTKLREALGRGAASLHLGEGKATLQLREEAPCWSLDLFKLPIAEARSQLQALVFGMAGHIESLERRLGGGSWSCNRQLCNTLSSLSCGYCQLPCCPSALPGMEGARAQPGGSQVSGVHSAQTPIPGKTGVLAQLFQRRGRSQESLSLTLASKARRHHLEWISRTPDLCCPVL
ncbi:protein PAXX isoform X4 [Phalacrocorax carbo]|uniref:protein PAXX isoform X4 n=1 Tax=Phalacrocorax carbo TaxID=9209 RepID=UPI003119960D